MSITNSHALPAEGHLSTRIIPCLDIENNRVVKGVRFVDIQDAGDPLSVAQQYAKDGADEICFLDITASAERRAITKSLVQDIARRIFIPFTVGGGIRKLEDIEAVLHAGADKVSLNTAAFLNPELISQASRHFGSQCIVCAIDARRSPQHPTEQDQASLRLEKSDSNCRPGYPGYPNDKTNFEVFLHGGRTATGKNAIHWAQEAASRGAGEILLTSMDRDGTKEGYDLELLSQVHQSVSIPVIASGGVGNLEHMKDAVKIGHADALLAASIFHFGQYRIYEAKDYLREQKIQVRRVYSEKV